MVIGTAQDGTPISEAKDDTSSSENVKKKNF
jgi:hypothetical protein